MILKFIVAVILCGLLSSCYPFVEADQDQWQAGVRGKNKDLVKFLGGLVGQQTQTETQK